MFLKNPLINRAVTLQAFYVFGQGMNHRRPTPTSTPWCRRSWTT
jgi:hypothetical protein